MSHRLLPDLATPDALPAERLQRRLAQVEEHLAAETAHDVARTLATFHGQGSFCLNGATMTGPEAIGGLYAMLYDAFPDLAVRVDSAEASANMVTLEVRITGTHRGPWQGVPATGRPIDIPLAALFPFDAQDRLLGERVYFDGAALMAQLGLLPAAP
jgi:steroid delta-isomerase-like uncharacterized protein